MNFLTYDIKKLYVKYLLASIGSATVMSIYSFVDAIAVGQAVGPMGTAAIAVLNPFFSIMVFLGILCGIGGAVLMGNAKGEGLEKRGNEYFTAALLMMCIIVAIGWILAFLFHEPIFRFFGADDESMPYVMEYGKWLIWFFPAYILPLFLAAFLRNDGAPGLATAGVIIGGSFNVFGDWLFCFPLDMGMTGAAIATVGGAGIQAIVMCLHFFRKEKCHLKLVFSKYILSDMRRVFTFGFGSGVLDFGNVVIAIIINNQILRYGGVAALSVYGAVGTISLLFQALFGGVGQAAQPLVSMNYGAHKYECVQKVFKMALMTVIAFGMLFTAVGECLPIQITQLFINASQEVLDVAPFVFRYYFPFFLFLGLSVFATYYLQSIMRERLAMTISVLRSLILSSLMLIVLPRIFGLMGVFIAMPVSECIVAILALILMKRANRSLV